MKILKNIISLAPVALVILTLFSCSKDFLEKPESNDVTIDTIFSTRIKAETFLWETYRTGVPMGFPHDWGRNDGMYASMVMAACDEGDVYDSWPGSNSHNTGSWSSSGNDEDDFVFHYKGIRNANIFLQNIDRVVDIPEGERQQMKAEAVFLRALQHAELLKRYGGVPIVDHVLTSSGEVKLPRNTYAECVDFIVKSCDEAAAVLPDKYTSTFSGRITKGAALALKGRVLLYAASPLANTNSPYSPEKRELTGYTDYKESRWQIAADANKALLDWAVTGGITLVKTDSDPGKNYETAVAQPNNSEIILANQSTGRVSGEFSNFMMPRGIDNGWYGHGVTLQQANKYYTKDGNDQVWPDQGTRAEFLSKMQEMEPRFQQSVFYSGSKWNDSRGILNFYKKSDGSWTSYAPVNGVGYMKKFLTRMNWGGQVNWIVFRLAEYYLNYAEALNEVSPMNPACYVAINEIRSRGGLPAITNADPRFNTQEKLRQAIRRERAVELAFEEHRFFDVRRWMIADEDGVMKGQMWGLNLYEQANGSIIYKKEPFETRVWNNKMYLYPLPQGEIDKLYMVQNPGW